MIVKQKNARGRWHILVMRSQGMVTDLVVSPLTLLLVFLFGLAFVVASGLVAHRYFNLYLEHRDLVGAHQEAVDKLHRLENLYAYQSTVASEYATLLNAGQRPEAAEPLPAAASAADPAAPEAGEPGGDDGSFFPGGAAAGDAPGPLDLWGDQFPDPPADQPLGIEKLEISGRTFRFHLTNEEPGTQVQGNILMLFAVATGDRLVLIPFPDFDYRKPEPDFTIGPPYNIRSSKPVTGQLDLPPDGRVMGMMAVAKSQGGQVVMKRVISPKP